MLSNALLTPALFIPVLLAPALLVPTFLIHLQQCKFTDSCQNKVVKVHMCFNACGFGALNMFWLIIGTIFCISALMSLDCSNMISELAGVAYHCSSPNLFLNAGWQVTDAGFNLTGVVLSLLPYIRVGISADANKAALYAFTVCVCVTKLATSAYLIICPPIFLDDTHQLDKVRATLCTILLNEAALHYNSFWRISQLDMILGYLHPPYEGIRGLITL